MIINENEIQEIVDTAPRGGEGENYSKKLVDEKYFNGKLNGFYVNSLQAKSSIGVHKHLNNQEAYFILSGEGEYFDNGEWKTVKKGDLLLCDKNEKHALKNELNDELKFIAFIINE